MVRISALIITVLLFTLIACKSEEPATTLNNEPTTTVTQAIKAAKESCETINTFYLTGLNDQNKQAREIYLGNGPITLNRDSLLQQAFDPAVSAPETQDYSNILDLYNYADIANELAYDDIPVIMALHEYQSLKELEWDSYYIKLCQSINQAFD